MNVKEMCSRLSIKTAGHCYSATLMRLTPLTWLRVPCESTVHMHGACKCSEQLLPGTAIVLTLAGAGKPLSHRFGVGICTQSVHLYLA